MKTITRFALGLSATLILASTSALAKSDSGPTFLSVTSPDHPDTWAAGAHQNWKALRWDSSRQKLIADVEYSTADYADAVDPTQTDEHSLTFPDVRLAGNGVDLLVSNHEGKRISIGHLKKGILGTEVILNKGVNLDVHRGDHGKIYASIVYDDAFQQ